MQNSTRWSDPPLKNSKFLRAGRVHRSRIANSYAREVSTAQKLQNLTRGDYPPLRKCRIPRSEEHTSELQSRFDLVCRLLLEKKKNKTHESVDLQVVLYV